jgi:hypothetical protein
MHYGFPLQEYLVTLRWIRMIEWPCLVKYVLGRRRVDDNRSRYCPFSRCRFYVVYVSDRICSFVWDWAGQLGESGEYQMERLRVVGFYIRSFEGGSPCLCQLRTTSVGSCCNKHWVVYWHIRDLCGPSNLVASTVAELDDTPLYFIDDIVIVFGSPMDYPSRFSCERRH